MEQNDECVRLQKPLENVLNEGYSNKRVTRAQRLQVRVPSSQWLSTGCHDGGVGDVACGGRTLETVPSILSHPAQPSTQGTGHIFIPKCQLYQDGELLLSRTRDFCKPSGFLIGANDCRCISFTDIFLLLTGLGNPIL